MLKAAEKEINMSESDFPRSHSYNRLRLYLIKPSKYDDDGYVVRHWKAVLPSNTLACLYGLTEDVRTRKVLGHRLKWKIEAIDETVQRVPIQTIVRSSKQKNTKTVICLVGVQSNQFPRARDLALTFRKAGMDVLIGGFHVSGILSTLRELPSDLTELKSSGVILVAGEVEGRWEMILKDALQKDLKPVYNFLNMPPDLSQAPMPKIPENLVNRYAVKRFATLDCGRGCPFACSFCTVINVQGRRMRFRAVDPIVHMIRDNYRRHKIVHYFFTDDNFCRNKNWETIFQKLTQMREEEKIPITFMMQVDTQSYRIPSFIEKAKRAGCTQVFIGMESINEKNLEAAGKKQNRISEFKTLIDRYHQASIVTHLAYIIGFPFDNEESVKGDIERLESELGAEQASFFMLTPLPGSMDYVGFTSKQVVVDADLNNYDTTHETFRHAQFKPKAWKRAYDHAWKHFYRFENMKKILTEAKKSSYWDIFLNFIWYKNAIQVEGGHPMLHGFVRLKGRLNRRPDYPVETRWAYGLRRLKDVWGTIVGWVKLAMEMEELWLATRNRSPLEERVLLELGHVHKRVTEWRSIRLTDLQAAYRRAVFALEIASPRKLPLKIRVPSLFLLRMKKWNVFSDSLTFTRIPMSDFWRDVLTCLRRGRIHQIRIHQVVFTSCREVILFLQFFFSLLRQNSFFRLKN